jgi:LysR family hydrogen peroxide-inducible transcriptional activator
MNLRDLKYLVEVAETRHFGKAAQRCFVSQPTLSGQIKKLEGELGVTLFERTNRSVEVTPVGEAVIRHARQILEQAEAMRQLARSFQDPLAGSLKVGAIPTISPYLIPLFLRSMKQDMPQMRLILSEEQTDVLLERLKQHEIDAALIATEHPETDFKAIALYEEPFWLAHPQDDPPPSTDVIRQQDLEAMEILLLSEGHCLADQVMEVCHLQERQQQGEFADLRASSLETLLQLVSAGYGSTLVPALAMDPTELTGRGIATRELSLPHSARRVSLIFRESFPRPAALRALANLILDHLPDSVTRLDGS